MNGLRPAFGLVEVMVASAILATVIGGTAYLATSAQRTSNFAADRNQAHILALEGIEHIRSVREANDAAHRYWLTGLLPLNATNSIAFQLVQNVWQVPTSGDYSSCQSTATDCFVNVSGNFITEAEGPTSGIFEVIRLQQTATSSGQANREYHRYITLQLFNPSVSFVSGTEPGASTPACQVPSCNYLNSSLFDETTKAPLDLNSSSADNPPAVLITSIVTWDGGQAGNREEAYSLMTDWKPSYE